ncbi:MAG: hypothetical protein RQ750_10760 [Roseovarius sp.]|nr:hypothetical protein [Roseovarius sp.]
MIRFLLAATLAFGAQNAAAQDTAPQTETETPAEAPMTLGRLDEIIRALDPDAQTNGRFWQMTIAGVKVMIITDETADRMRAITPVRKLDEMSQEDITRVLQANFDTALDARYAIAKDVLWSAFIHPLKALEKEEFISGLGQVVNLAESYGTLYSSGALQYGGGDSGALQRQLIDDLLKKGQEL